MHLVQQQNLVYEVVSTLFFKNFFYGKHIISFIETKNIANDLNTMCGDIPQRHITLKM